MKKIAIFLFEGAELFEIASFTDVGIMLLD